MSIKIFGLSQCNTVKKARQWLNDNNIVAEFVDFKKTPPSQRDLEFWLSQIPKESLINRKGTTWRNLNPAEQQTALSCDRAAIELMMTQPSIIKRPVLTYKNQITIGFNPEHYQKFLSV
ncbi:MAG: Spx/MgsR family RNA polymerase-binding regulatory protein [Snodgrassella sp.]|nr:Spx/MgsR family RNA polymerase-binding regulatory protein [Snodgrassella sp.]